MITLGEVEQRVGLPLQDHQKEAATDAAFQAQRGPAVRLCLYHRTGAGKTYTSLVCARQAGAHEVLVLAPPITHEAWIEWGRRVGIDVIPISHAKFRQKDYKLDRKRAVIVDEFHLLGGHGGQGWKKLDRLAKGLQAPLIIASATPNYNDAERVYCVMHVMAPETVKGGYIEFLYQNCTTEQNPFGKEPIVTGFRHFDDAENFLKSLPYVHYVEDEAIKQLVVGDVPIIFPLPDAFEEYGLDARRGRIMASQMEERHARKRHQLIGEDGLIRTSVWNELELLIGNATGPALMYCDSATIATALHLTCISRGAQALLITGKDTTRTKASKVRDFVAGRADILVGTATLATGTDGVDKMCDDLIIVDDTTDDSLRRQLMGRILPRGLDTDVSKKRVTRLVLL